MRSRLLSLLLLGVYCAASVAAEPVQAPMSVDTPILDLLQDPRTRPVVERHLPQLAKKLQEDQSAAEFLGNSTVRELSADPHVRGITEEILTRLRADLLAAQKAAD